MNTTAGPCAICGSTEPMHMCGGSVSLSNLPAHNSGTTWESETHVLRSRYDALAIELADARNDIKQLEKECDDADFMEARIAALKALLHRAYHRIHGNLHGEPFPGTLIDEIEAESDLLRKTR